MDVHWTMNNLSTKITGGLRKCTALIREQQGYLKYTSSFYYNFRKVSLTFSLFQPAWFSDGDNIMPLTAMEFSEYIFARHLGISHKRFCSNSWEDCEFLLVKSIIVTLRWDCSWKLWQKVEEGPWGYEGWNNVEAAPLVTEFWPFSLSIFFFVWVLRNTYHCV